MPVFIYSSNQKTVLLHKLINDKVKSLNLKTSQWNNIKYIDLEEFISQPTLQYSSSLFKQSNVLIIDNCDNKIQLIESINNLKENNNIYYFFIYIGDVNISKQITYDKYTLCSLDNISIYNVYQLACNIYNIELDNKNISHIDIKYKNINKYTTNYYNDLWNDCIKFAMQEYGIQNNNIEEKNILNKFIICLISKQNNNIDYLGLKNINMTLEKIRFLISQLQTFFISLYLLDKNINYEYTEVQQLVLEYRDIWNQGEQIEMLHRLYELYRIYSFSEELTKIMIYQKRIINNWINYIICNFNNYES